MAFADKKGIVVASPFKLQAESMLDVRQQVDTITERNELVTIKAATAGLRVYVKETKKSYVYNGTSWDELSVGNASLIVKLNSGTSEGTNMFTYNGTTNKTINITAAGIGAAGKTHNHTKSEITDFPTSLKNPQALKFTGAATASYDGSAAVTVNIPTTSKTTKSLIVTLNGGTTEGTNKFTFNGSAEKTINITPSTIGAAAATHTHDKSQITGLTTGRALISDTNGHPAVSAVTSTELGYLDGVTSNIQTQLNGKAASTHTHNYAGSSSAGGSANSAVKLATARKINGTSFDGTKDINIQNNYFESVSEQNLNSFRTYGEYYGAGGNDCTNRPSGVDSFYLKIFRNASGYTAQSLYSVGVWYSRYYDGSSWSTWSKQYSSTSKPTASEIGAASSSHTHTKSQITDFPTSLKNPNALTFAGAVTGTYDGSKAVTINIPTTGATTKSSLTIQLNGGTTEGTNKFTFNGGTAKTINITPSAIGAAASSHNHAASNITSGTLPVARGGTGITANPSMLTNLGSTTAAGVFQTSPRPGITGTLAIAHGGTGATSASAARTALGAAAASHTHNYAGSSSAGGAANSAVKLNTARKINGTSFDGTKDITLSAMYAEDLSNKNVSLNTYNLSSGSPKVKYYYCPTDGAGDGITGRPNDNQKTAFFLICQSIRFSSTSDYITKQTYIHGSTKTTWERYCVSGTWSAWGERYTSQNKPTASEIGAATSSHTHKYAGSSSAGGAANSVKSSLTLQFNGTTKATFNGSAAATVNITPSAIGAAASSHTHSYLPLSGGTVTGDIGLPSGRANKDGSTPLAGSTITNLSSITKLANYKTVLGSYTDSNSKWYDIISVRHRNGNGDGSSFGMYLKSDLTVSGNLSWGKQYGPSSWQAERTLIDSSNYGSWCAAKSHTHNYAGSSSAGGAANSVKSALTLQFNGTTKATFNGSAAATVNITPAAIGAAASSHTHKYAGSSSAGGAATSATKVPVPVGTVLFSTAGSATFFSSCFGGTWEVLGNIDAILGSSSKVTLFMFRKISD